MMMIKKSLKPYIGYGFPLGIQSDNDTSGLDGIIARTAKRTLRLPMSTPTKLILKQKTASGASTESLLIDYVQLNTVYLARALSDGGRLGVIITAMLQAQAARLGRISTSQIGNLQSNYRLMRQLELIKSTCIKIDTPSSTSQKENAYAYAKLISRDDGKNPLMCLDIASLQSHMHSDPKLVGEEKAIALSIIHDLSELEEEERFTHPWQPVTSKTVPTPKR